MTVLIHIQHPVPQWRIPDAVVESLRARFPDVSFVNAKTPEERAAGLADADVLYTWILSAAELARAPKVRWFHTSAVALETLCLPELFARGVRVSNTRGVQAVPIAEHVLAMLLAFAKQVPFTLVNQATAHWAQTEYMGTRQPWLITGRTLGLVGVGTIGSALAERAAALGMNVMAVRRQLDGDAVPGITRTFAPSELHDMLRLCDVVVVAAPLTAETEGVFDARAFAAMRPGAIFINVGRARIVETDALIAALRSGHLGGASLDVFPQEPLPPEHPLWTCPNVILTPHTSGFRQGHWEEVGAIFAENFERLNAGEPLMYEVRRELGY
ncbi:MAG: D-2-hydroxyacid dehydrogenase [Acidobacteria bacterium]|nr:D-2-hydroxyacid dehydrogenase [Acidobacteriota bacterium]